MRKIEMPTRAQAIEVLYKIMNCGILDNDLEDCLQDIVTCIKSEDKENDLGIDIWGDKEGDWVDLYIAKRQDLITPEWEQHCDAVYEKYRIKG